jgi:quercetin dioxygenase-like cupin family protein
MSFGVLAVTGILWAATVQEKKPEPAKQEVVLVSADQAKFKEVAPSASMAVISGDPDKGAYRVFTKFAPGASFALHTHTSEIRIVVIKGAYLYKPEKGEEKRVGPGCYIDIPGGDRHSSGGDAKEGALFYQESIGKFDLVPVDKEKE